MLNLFGLLEPSDSAGGNVQRCRHYIKLAGPQNVKSMVPLCPSNCIPRYVFEATENTCPHRNYPVFACCTQLHSCPNGFWLFSKPAPF